MRIERIAAWIHGCWRRANYFRRIDAILESQGFVLEVVSQNNIITTHKLEIIISILDELKNADSAERAAVIEYIDTAKATIQKLTEKIDQLIGESSNAPLIEEAKQLSDASIAFAQKMHDETNTLRTPPQATETQQPAQSNDVVGNPGTGNAEAPADAIDAAAQAEGNSATAIGSVGNQAST